MDPLKLAFWSAEPLPVLLVVDLFKSTPFNGLLEPAMNLLIPEGIAVLDASLLISVQKILLIV